MVYSTLPPKLRHYFHPDSLCQYPNTCPNATHSANCCPLFVDRWYRSEYHSSILWVDDDPKCPLRKKRNLPQDPDRCAVEFDPKAATEYRRLSTKRKSFRIRQHIDPEFAEFHRPFSNHTRLDKEFGVLQRWHCGCAFVVVHPPPWCNARQHQTIISVLPMMMIHESCVTNTLCGFKSAIIDLYRARDIMYISVMGINM
jgi:hypothetical protein